MSKSSRKDLVLNKIIEAKASLTACDVDDFSANDVLAIRSCLSEAEAVVMSSLSKQYSSEEE